MIKKQPSLKRSLGLFEVVFYGIGVIIGAGIYALIGKAAGLAGNMVWAAFFLGAVIAAITGLSYAELSSMFPKAGAEYVYTENAFGRSTAFLIGWTIIVGGVIAIAAVALGFGGYFSELTGLPIVPVAFTLIALVAFANYLGVKHSAELNVLLTSTAVIGLFIIVVAGLFFADFSNVNLMQLPSTGMAGILGASALIFFAYLGFEDIVNMAEETKHPKKTLPKAIALAIVISTIFYILVAVAAVGLMPAEQLAASPAPLAAAASTIFGENAFTILAIIALFATSSTVLILTATISRILYGMASDKKQGLPKILSLIHRKRRIPWAAILIVSVAAIAFTFVGEIETVASLTTFAVFASFILINLSVIKLRYSLPRMHRGFKIPGSIGKFPVLPAAGAIICTFMLFQYARDVILAGLVIIAIGFIIGRIVHAKNHRKRK